MGIIVTQSQNVAAQTALALSATGAETASGNATVVARLPRLATGATASQSATIAARAVLVLAGSAQTSATQQVEAASTLPPLRASGRVQSLNVNTATIVATLPRLRGSGTLTSTGSAQVTGRLRTAARSMASASQAIHAGATLPRMWGFVSLGAQGYAHVDATLGPLSASITVQPPPSGYAADGHYYAALPARPFYATLDARAFYAPIGSRSFYVLSDNDVTPTFDTLDPRETVTLTLDASNDLADGETLVSVSEVTATQQSGVPGTLPTLTGEVINTQPLTFAVNGKTVTIAAGHGVQVTATGGQSDCRYLIAAICTTSNPDKVLVLKGVLPVSAN